MISNQHLGVAFESCERELNNLLITEPPRTFLVVDHKLSCLSDRRALELVRCELTAFFQHPERVQITNLRLAKAMEKTSG
jgi:hypothetical protein